MRFKPNNRGFYDVRRMPKLIELLEEKAEKVAAEANSNLRDPEGYAGVEHFMTGSRQGARRPQGRWRTSVFTATEYAKRADAKHNLLIKALY
jgi:hypothetical protein